MSRTPRLLPLLGVVAVGLLAVNALGAASALPDLLGGKARAEAAAAPPPKPAAKPAAPPKPKPTVCAPTAADLARQAGLSPSELRILQSLGARRGELDQREKDLSTQLTLMAAAEAKLDARLKALTAVKAEITRLVGQADGQKTSEVDRLVRVYEKMKAKDAAAIFVPLDDKVRLPVAAKMKEQALAMVLAQMPPAEAKTLTERLAARFEADALAARARAAAASVAAPAKPAAPRPA